MSLKAALILVESCVDAELCNTGGTLDFQLRVHKFAITLTPAPHATLANPSGPDLQFRYIDTIRFTGPDRTPCTGLDADVTGSISHGGAKFQGDGFGGGGPGGRRIRIDSEGLVLDPDGAFRASDEYGPYIYRFSPNGRMTLAIHPPEAYIPRRNGTISFSADSPPYYNPNETIISADTTTGHDNNQGFEVLTVSDDGKLLYALIQFTLDQEGGLYNPYRLNARFIEYDISNFVPRVHQGISGNATALYSSGQKKKTRQKSRQKAKSISSRPTHFLVAISRLWHRARPVPPRCHCCTRHADIVDISHATGHQVTSERCLRRHHCPAAAQVSSTRASSSLLSTARSSTSTSTASSAASVGTTAERRTRVPARREMGVFGSGTGQFRERQPTTSCFVLFSLSDDDFVTLDGVLDGEESRYKDGNGFDLDNQALVFRIGCRWVGWFLCSGGE